MAGANQIPYTSNHRLAQDGSMTFTCSDDVSAWRWLALPAHHPIYIQTFNYYISVECSAARGARDPSKWSALTWMDWKMGDPEAGLATHGRMENQEISDKLGFEMWLYDAQDRLVHRASGKGVVFRNRDFEGWRSQAKDKLNARLQPPAFNFASREAVGAFAGEHALLAPLREGQTQTAALVTDANGMPPGSRFLDGSGDHVNAVHLAEVGRQFCALLTGEPTLTLSGGEISFTRYVEMNVPFSISLIDRNEETIEMVVEQASERCTRMTYRIR